MNIDAVRKKARRDIERKLTPKTIYGESSENNDPDRFTVNRSFLLRLSYGVPNYQSGMTIPDAMAGSCSFIRNKSEVGYISSCET